MSSHTQKAVCWSIAIHGGAGRGPATWTQDKRDSRQRALDHSLKIGRDVLAQGGSAIDAVEAAVVALEDDGSFHAGRGATLTSAGGVELDASIMDGSTAACGAVAGIGLAKNPIRVARRVMQATSHVLLVGQGADAFSLEQGFPRVPTDYFLARQGKDTADPPADESELRFGTVGCVARDGDGDLAAATSTSGTSGKLPGRTGDSPIIGAGTFAANDAGAISATGQGEEFIRRCVAYDLIAQVRYANRTLAEAAREMIRNRLPTSTGGIIAVDAHGELSVIHNTPGMSWGVADGDGRFETGFFTLSDQ